MIFDFLFNYCRTKISTSNRYYRVIHGPFEVRSLHRVRRLVNPSRVERTIDGTEPPTKIRLTR
eukprot:CAMPEP_0172530274 /NCGR_PEP_ID=MMETSP1067-20121228/4057_1 /TAXON_ID=265564 ORGANISM="Thalassiosira punctigera, Strain Tpunct2005C2" /NCGR_SAMPLE_ID=MMETSP1067 /ASSEMBLY_ACC=CAM_ASM_000444 /LENGTH=62 /DNA_ID=CAMNT_0013314443 /DNA_START=21 /DNA_END=206 /DNA_ORIENTATION=-